MKIVETNNIQFGANFKLDKHGYCEKLAKKENPLNHTSILLDKLKNSYPQHELEILSRIKDCGKTTYKISNNTSGKKLDIIVDSNNEEFNSLLKVINKEIDTSGDFFDCTM